MNATHQQPALTTKSVSTAWGHSPVPVRLASKWWITHVSVSEHSELWMMQFKHVGSFSCTLPHYPYYYMAMSVFLSIRCFPHFFSQQVQRLHWCFTCRYILRNYNTHLSWLLTDVWTYTFTCFLYFFAVSTDIELMFCVLLLIDDLHIKLCYVKIQDQNPSYLCFHNLHTYLIESVSFSYNQNRKFGCTSQKQHLA